MNFWTANSLLFFLAKLLHEKPKHASRDKRKKREGKISWWHTDSFKMNNGDNNAQRQQMNRF